MQFLYHKLTKYIRYIKFKQGYIFCKILLRWWWWGMGMANQLGHFSATRATKSPMKNEK